MSFTLSVLTPTSTALKNVKIKRALVPTQRGQIEVLPEHTHVVTRLSGGVLEYETEYGMKEVFVAEGVCKVLKSEIKILAEICVKKDDIDKEDLSLEIEETEKKLSYHENMSDIDYNKFSKSLEYAKTQISMV